ncbi:uncharacterized protein SPSK_06776 [Sporothrix schenckii 1099-18]|uniref:Uncharacterized protein n=2 Tax=Sporothrix schenckii TaxID=29908 RepID=U7PKB3_SPOS1|nr:uncharacterized protein SPSK_06776 [Sporothrix schenckii 1099-18]ERS95174.1 hypothetical protein HMPREF1624_08385 [Sporothrix schenckii ATCC 58251]KJR89964.1 hypothetical protein SPSK_06776 [Sporothrix schenckii 1099-18]
MTIESKPPPARRPMQMEAAADSTKTVAQQPPMEPRPAATVDASQASLRGGNLSLGCHCCHGSCSFYKSCC